MSVEQKTHVVVIRDTKGRLLYIGKPTLVNKEELNNLINEQNANMEEIALENKQLKDRLDSIEKDLKEIKGE